MITIITTLIGVMSGLLPNLVKLWEQKSADAHELDMLKLQIDAQVRNVEFQTITDEGASLRQHDSTIVTTGFLETLRASVRPVVTYVFFFLFCGIKLYAITLMSAKGYTPVDIINAVWDNYTMAVFGSILGFWFGSRAITKMNEDLLKSPRPVIKIVPVTAIKKSSDVRSTTPTSTSTDLPIN